MRLQLVGILAFFSLTPICSSQSRAEWNRQAQDTLKRIIASRQNYNVAKNVIFFLGDGMGPSTVTAGRIFTGQQEGRRGEDEDLSFDRFPNVALSKTYTEDKMIPDSAATATAFLCGVKARGYTLGLDSSAYYENCSTQAGSEVDSILKWSMDAGKAGGIVTTTRITHATPAASYAHTVNRFWEADNNVPTEDKSRGCTDIAAQFVKNAMDVKVVLGGGWKHFLPNTSDPNVTTTGQRQDKRNLIQEWEDNQRKLGRKFRFVNSASQLDDVKPETTDYVLGLFSESHLPYDIDIEEKRASGPRLKDLTRKAIQMLEKKSDKGYFLLVEGGRIDHGHHAAKAKHALGDVRALHEAVQTAVDMTDDSDTLIVVTADHSHVFTIGSYTARGVDILGLSDNFASGGTLDGKPVTTVLYGNGPGAPINETRQNLTGFDFNGNPDYLYQAAAPLDSETHGGEDVAIYAKGPMSHLFTGVLEQNYIAHAMAYASCVGTNKEHCTAGCKKYGNCPPPTVDPTGSAGCVEMSFSVIFLGLVVSLLKVLQ